MNQELSTTVAHPVLMDLRLVPKLTVTQLRPESPFFRSQPLGAKDSAEAKAVQVRPLCPGGQSLESRLGNRAPGPDSPHQRALSGLGTCRSNPCKCPRLPCAYRRQVAATEDHAPGGQLFRFTLNWEYTIQL